MELMSCPKCKCDWFEEREIARFDKKAVNFHTETMAEEKKILYACVECGHTIASPEKQVFRDVKVIVFARESGKINYIKSIALPYSEKKEKTHVVFKHLKTMNNFSQSIGFKKINVLLWVGHESMEGMDVEYEYCGLPDTKTILLTNKEYSAVNERIKQDYPDDKYNVEIVDRTED